MTAINTGYFNAISVNMADEDIELVSSPPEQVGNDDIDIDFDLSGGQHDEDFILEDVQSERGLEEAIIGNDDIMQDEENASYHMDDVDLMREEHAENLQMEDAYGPGIPRTDFISTEAGHIQGEYPEEYTLGLNGASEAAMDDLTDHRTLFIDGVEEPVLDIQEEDETEFVNRRETGIIEFSTRLSPGHEKSLNERPPAGQNGSPGPGTASPKSAGSATQNQTDQKALSELAGRDAHDQNGADPVPHSNNNTLRPKVIVVWRDAEYDLIAASDADDPDSFFLKDAKLTKEPLTNLLAALREVVLDELTAEDELCLVVEDLGLEVAETSSTVPDTTFENILDLYEKLVRNDGVETPEPLCIILGTKSHFAKRLANLNAAAADGKGLSEFLSWEGSQELETEDQSINHEGSEQLFTAEIDNAAVLNKFTQQERDEAGPETATEQNGEGDLDQQTIRATDGSKLLEAYGQTDNDEYTNGPAASNASIKPYEDEEAEPHAQNPTAIPEGAETADYPQEEVDEDGDLIDYSDDELPQQEDPAVPAESLSQGNESGTQNASNEDLRQRSLSLVAEREELQVFAADQPDDFGNEQNNAHVEPGPGTYDSDGGSSNEIGHVEDDSATQGWDDEDEYKNDPEDGEDHLEISENQVTSQVEIYEDEDEDGQDVPIATSEILLNQDELADPLEDRRLDNVNRKGYAASIPVDDITSSLNSPTIKRDTTKDAYLDPDEISYDETEILNSNESEQTLVADEPVQDPEIHEVIHDEIGYEDDDHADLSLLLEPTITVDTSPISNGQSGKRPRADADETSEGDPKYSKRLRS